MTPAPPGHDEPQIRGTAAPARRRLKILGTVLVLWLLVSAVGVTAPLWALFLIGFFGVKRLRDRLAARRLLLLLSSSS